LWQTRKALIGIPKKRGGKSGCDEWSFEREFVVLFDGSGDSCIVNLSRQFLLHCIMGVTRNDIFRCGYFVLPCLIYCFSYDCDSSRHCFAISLSLPCLGLGLCFSMFPNPNHASCAMNRQGATTPKKTKSYADDYGLAGNPNPKPNPYPDSAPSHNRNPNPNIRTQTRTQTRTPTGLKTKKEKGKGKGGGLSLKKTVFFFLCVCVSRCLAVSSLSLSAVCLAGLHLCMSYF
jgi:hypothetical protein